MPVLLIHNRGRTCSVIGILTLLSGALFPCTKVLIIKLVIRWLFGNNHGNKEKRGSLF